MMGWWGGRGCGGGTVIVIDIFTYRYMHIYIFIYIFVDVVDIRNFFSQYLISNFIFQTLSPYPIYVNDFIFMYLS